MTSRTPHRPHHPTGLQWSMPKRAATASTTVRRTVTIGIAAVGALLVWVIADPIAGVDLAVRSGSGDRQIGPTSVLVTSLLAGLAAAGLAVMVGRSNPRPRRVWTAFASAALVLSLAGPLGARSVDVGLALAAMHVIVGGTLILGIGATLARDLACETPEV